METRDLLLAVVTLLKAEISRSEQDVSSPDRFTQKFEE